MVMVRNKIWQVFLISHLPGFEDVSTQVIPIDLALQKLFSPLALAFWASVNIADSGALLQPNDSN